MNIKFFLPIAALAGAVSCQTTRPASPPASVAAANAAAPLATYATYCSGCHGEKLEAFVDRQWKHGSSVEALTKSIADGHPEGGMPAWAGTLSEMEITALAKAINEKLGTVAQYKFDQKPKSAVFVSTGQTVRLDTVASGIDVPWGMAFLPDGNYLITNRNGEVYRVDSRRHKTLITGTPEVYANGQGGMLDVATHPNYAANGWVYLAYSKPKKEGEKTLSTTAVVRGKIQGNQWVESQEIFEALPYYDTRYHYGSRLEFDKRGYLFITVGDRGREKINPQDLTNGCGKVHRLFDDGRIPADNPFYTSAGAVKSIYSYGHRNPQGMVMDPQTGLIWTHEHGPRGGDELNPVRAGTNYGWPVISYGINYDGTTFTNLTAKEGMEQPAHYWIPSIGPSGLAIASAKYSAWKDNLMVGSLRFNYLNRCVMKNGKVVSEEKLLPNIGRMRMVETGPDGYLYIGVETPGYVFRLLPQ